VESPIPRQERPWCRELKSLDGRPSIISSAVVVWTKASPRSFQPSVNRSISSINCTMQRCVLPPNGCRGDDPREDLHQVEPGPGAAELRPPLSALGSLPELGVSACSLMSATE
jgi:hypothetical protein